MILDYIRKPDILEIKLFPQNTFIQYYINAESPRSSLQAPRICNLVPFYAAFQAVKPLAFMSLSYVL